MILSRLTIVCVCSLVAGVAQAQGVSVSRPGARGTISSAGMSYPRSSSTVSSGAAAPRASTVYGSLQGPVGDHVIGGGTHQWTASGESRFDSVDTLLLILALAPSCAQLALLAYALPRLADVQRLEELVAAFSDPASRREAQALVDESE